MEANGLAQAWFFILAFVFLLYILSDGYDLGVGILTLLVRDAEFIENSMNGLLGVWHANQTWLVIFGAI
ncbi:MAG: cytochrome d ubiquinol oxidase subunit II, partial [Pseudomonadota bacterium]